MHHLVVQAALAFSAPSVAPQRSATWGGALNAEAQVAVQCVQKAMQLCQALACDMQVVSSSAGGKEMDECDVTAGVSFIKEGDSTPVTAADFAIQGLISAELQKAFPNDRFMGEEDAQDLRDDEALRALALRLCGNFADTGELDEASFLASIDRGLEPPRGKSERVWVLDPIDGTKGCTTGADRPRRRSSPVAPVVTARRSRVRGCASTAAQS